MEIPLLKLMSADVAEQRTSILSAAKREAEEIEARARKTGEARHGNAIALVDAEVQAMADRARGRAEAESHMVLMTTKDTIADELLSSLARELAARADSTDFPAVLELLLEEVMQEGPEEGVVLAPRAYVEFCASWLGRHGYRHQVEGVDFLRDGVAVQDARGAFRITNTLSTRFERQKNVLRRLCIEMLFDKGTQA